jgi:DNA primase
MGTALTERQLRELNRLTKRLFLCFDADAAGQEATLRGMDLADKLGFNIQVVSLPAGTDPADDPAGFERRLETSVSYPVHRVRLLYERARDKSAASAAIQAFLNSLPDSPEHQDARRLVTDLLDLPPESQAAFAPSRGRSSAASVISPRLLDAGKRLERSALAGVAANPKLTRYLEELGPEHFDDELHRRARAHLLGQETQDDALTPLLAELYAIGDRDELTEETAEQLLLRLRERRLQRQLNDAKPDHFLELQKRLAEVRTAIREFA